MCAKMEQIVAAIENLMRTSGTLPAAFKGHVWLVDKKMG